MCCECGNLKLDGMECCLRCSYLDGVPKKKTRGARYSYQPDAIAAMRNARWWTPPQLAEVLGITPKSTWTVLGQLLRADRVERLLVDEGVGKPEIAMFRLVDRRFECRR